MSDDSMTAVVACAAGKSNGVLVERWCELGLRAQLLTPDAASTVLMRGDTALVRLDVLQTLDGIEPGFDAIEGLEARGVRVLNTTAALARAHDKLETSRLLQAARVPIPASAHLNATGPVASLELPVVIKPRFGSWGRDITLCQTRDDVEQCLSWARERPWFQRHGALIEQYVPSGGVDRRVLVAGGRVVGRIERVAARGEWRTNISLGGIKRRAPSAPEADALAVRAAAAIGMDFSGVDLIHSGRGWLVIEINGAVDFDADYSLENGDVFSDIAAALNLPAPTRAVAEPATLSQ